MTPDQLRWLTWGAIQHRPHGAPKWDEPGTAKAIADHCGTWDLDVATTHVLAHARDPKARTPFAIKGLAPSSTEPVRHVRQPPKIADECRRHPGEWADHCRACAGDRLAGEAAGEAGERRRSTHTSERIAELRAALRGEAS